MSSEQGPLDLFFVAARYISSEPDVGGARLVAQNGYFDRRRRIVYHNVKATSVSVGLGVVVVSESGVQAFAKTSVVLKRLDDVEVRLFSCDVDDLEMVSRFDDYLALRVEMAREMHSQFAVTSGLDIYCLVSPASYIEESDLDSKRVAFHDPISNHDYTAHIPTGAGADAAYYMTKGYHLIRKDVLEVIESSAPSWSYFVQQI